MQASKRMYESQIRVLKTSLEQRQNQKYYNVYPYSFVAAYSHVETCLTANQRSTVEELKNAQKFAIVNNLLLKELDVKNDRLIETEQKCANYIAEEDRPHQAFCKGLAGKSSDEENLEGICFKLCFSWQNEVKNP